MTPASPVSPPSPGERTTTTLSEEAEVIAAYERFWEVVLEAEDPLNPDHPSLRTVADDEALKRVQNVIKRYLEAGYLVAGDLRILSATAQVSGPTATIRSCLHDMSRLSTSSGEVIEPPDNEAFVWKAHLRSAEGRWKVTRIRITDKLCDAS